MIPIEEAPRRTSQSGRTPYRYHGEPDILPPAEMRRLIQKHRQRKLGRRPLKGEKSTVLGIKDIFELSRPWGDESILWKFLRGDDHPKNFGPVTRRRVTRILLLIEAGHVEKHKVGQYTIHKTPFKAPAPPAMRVVISATGVSLVHAAPLPKPSFMPNFAQALQIGR